jgi:hypothetical protein
MASPKNEEAIGSIFIHSNGAATVKSIQGQFFITDKDYHVLASLSSNESVTIPSINVKSPSQAMVAQVGGPATGLPEAGKVIGAAPTMAGAGVEDLAWIWLGVALTVGMVTYIAVCQ